MKLITTVLCVCIVTLNANSQQSGEVKYLSYSDGVITLSSAGYGKKQIDCIKNAEHNAFEVLFFRGVPGSPQSSPLIGFDEKAKSESNKYFKDFYNSERYKTFLTYSQASSEPQKGKKKGY